MCWIELPRGHPPSTMLPMATRQAFHLSPYFRHQKTLEWKLQRVPVQAYLVYRAPGTWLRVHFIKYSLHEWMNGYFQLSITKSVHQTYPDADSPPLALLALFSKRLKLETCSQLMILLWVLYGVLSISALICFSISFVPRPTTRPQFPRQAFPFFWGIIFFFQFTKK